MYMRRFLVFFAFAFMVFWGREGGKKGDSVFNSLLLESRNPITNKQYCDVQL